MQETTGVAQMAVRQDLDEVRRAEPAQHLAAQDDQPAVLEHPHLAAIFVLDVARGLFPCDGLRLEDGAASVLHHQIRQREIVAEARVDVDVVGAADRVDRPDAAGDRAEPRLVSPQPRLPAPVCPLAVRSVRRFVEVTAADVGDIGVGEVAGELSQRVGLPLGIGIRKGQDLPFRLAYGKVLRRDLAAARAPEQPHTRLVRGDRFDELVRAVGRFVGCDDDVEPVGRIVERKQVLEPALDHALLVVRGNDDAHGGGEVALAHGPGPHAREQRGRERVTGLRPGERPERRPEQNLRDHRSNRRIRRRLRRSGGLDGRGQLVDGFLRVLGFRKSGLSMPAKPGFMLRFSTTTCCALSTFRIGIP